MERKKKGINLAIYFITRMFVGQDKQHPNVSQYLELKKKHSLIIVRQEFKDNILNNYLQQREQQRN
jgi:hypothetical protein